MLRIDAANNANALPAPIAGPNAPGFFNNNPGAGPGTVVSGDWLNRVQEEVIAPILAAGLALDPADNGQLLKALYALFPVTGHARLTWSSNVQLLLLPAGGGDTIKVNGKSYAIPGAGIAVANANVEISGVANQNLAASTDYLLYVKDDGAGNLVPSFWPLGGGHRTDTTAGNIGVEVRNNAGVADSTRSLVGLVGTDGASHFATNLLRSWYQRYPNGGGVGGVTGATTSASPVGVMGTVTFMCWADDVVTALAGGYMLVRAGGLGQAQFTFDGAFPGSGPAVAGGNGVADTYYPFFSGASGWLAEGRHSAAVLGWNTGAFSTVNYAGQVTVAVR